jgi:hypothetical protein
MNALVLANFPIAFLIFAAMVGIPLWLTFKRPDRAPQVPAARLHAVPARMAPAGSVRARMVPARPVQARTVPAHLVPARLVPAGSVPGHSAARRDHVAA